MWGERGDRRPFQSTTDRPGSSQVRHGRVPTRDFKRFYLGSGAGPDRTGPTGTPVPNPRSGVVVGGG